MTTAAAQSWAAAFFIYYTIECLDANEVLNLSTNSQKPRSNCRSCRPQNGETKRLVFTPRWVIIPQHHQY
jgi:hypothetical protein